MSDTTAPSDADFNNVTVPSCRRAAPCGIESVMTDPYANNAASSRCLSRSRESALYAAPFKLKRASKPQIRRLAQLKTSGERRLIAS
jgi:hypothetical protein